MRHLLFAVFLFTPPSPPLRKLHLNHIMFIQNFNLPCVSFALIYSFLSSFSSLPPLLHCILNVIHFLVVSPPLCLLFFLFLLLPHFLESSLLPPLLKIKIVSRQNIRNLATRIRKHYTSKPTRLVHPLLKSLPFFLAPPWFHLHAHPQFLNILVYIYPVLFNIYTFFFLHQIPSS